ncbi:amino acid ABC transporter permease, partial [Pseudomonas aeruginosa]
MNSLQKLLEWLANLVELLGMAWPFLLQGAMYTVLFAAVSMVLGLILGFSVAVVRVTKVPVVSQIAAVYVSAFRGTPLLVQIFVLYYGLPSVGIEFTPVTAGILALTLNVAAYLSESMRGAILGIDKGQWEAGLSVGLTWGQTLWNIITPQALRLAVPSLSNSLISLIKDTSLISVITVTELMLATKEVIAETFQPLPLYLAAAGIYWLLSADSVEKVAASPYRWQNCSVSERGGEQ